MTVMLKISSNCAVGVELITSHKVALLMSCDIYMALSCMGSTLKLYRLPHDSTVDEVPLFSVLADVCDTGSQCGPQCPLRRLLIKAWAQTALPGSSPTRP